MTNKHWHRLLIASDLHGCYLDRDAYAVFLQVAASFPWDQCILNGDVADFSQLMNHDKKLGTYEREFRDCISLDEEVFYIKTDIFRPLRKSLKKTPILMRLGNHETRYLQVSEA